MACSINRLLSRGSALALLLAFGALGAGCAGNAAALADFRYDLGPVRATPANQATPATPDAAAMPVIKVLEVSAPDMIESTKFTYRLGYVDEQKTAFYANSHWTMSPAQLLTQRLRTALSARGTVLTGADGVRAPVLKVDLSEFEQVFDSQTESHGAVTARATLTHDGKVIGQRTFIARAPASSPDAAGGAQALAAASDELISEMTAWLGVQALVAAQ